MGNGKKGNNNYELLSNNCFWFMIISFDQFENQCDKSNDYLFQQVWKSVGFTFIIILYENELYFVDRSVSHNFTFCSRSVRTGAFLSIILIINSMQEKITSASGLWLPLSTSVKIRMTIVMITSFDCMET